MNKRIDVLNNDDRCDKEFNCKGDVDKHVNDVPEAEDGHDSSCNDLPCQKQKSDTSSEES